eukprot:COSAG04_NODE_4754_length_1908_cov_1.270868_4_plen_206_part_00
MECGPTRPLHRQSPHEQLRQPPDGAVEWESRMRIKISRFRLLSTRSSSRTLLTKGGYLDSDALRAPFIQRTCAHALHFRRPPPPPGCVGAAATAIAAGLLLRWRASEGLPGFLPLLVVRCLAVLGRLPPEGCFSSCTLRRGGEKGLSPAAMPAAKRALSPRMKPLQRGASPSAAPSSKTGKALHWYSYLACCCMLPLALRVSRMG